MPSVLTACLVTNWKFRANVINEKNLGRLMGTIKRDDSIRASQSFYDVWMTRMHERGDAMLGNLLCFVYRSFALLKWKLSLFSRKQVLSEKKVGTVYIDVYPWRRHPRIS
jgi:hypothetical protein